MRPNTVPLGMPIYRAELLVSGWGNKLRGVGLPHLAGHLRALSP